MVNWCLCSHHLQVKFSELCVDDVYLNLAHNIVKTLLKCYCMDLVCKYSKCSLTEIWRCASSSTLIQIAPRRQSEHWCPQPGSRVIEDPAWSDTGSVAAGKGGYCCTEGEFGESQILTTLLLVTHKLYSVGSIVLRAFEHCFGAQ